MTSRRLSLYIKRESFIHAIDARSKLLILLGFAISVSLIPKGYWWGFGIAFALLLMVVIIARFSPTLIIRRAIAALPFSLATVPAMFTKKGTALWHISIGWWNLSVTQEGIVFAVSIVVVSLLSAGAVGLFMAVTPFSETLNAMRWFRIPAVFVEILSSTYRYMNLLIEEARHMLNARNSRSATVPEYRGGGSLAWRAKIAGSMTGTFFIRTLIRSEQVHSAMVARGYGNNPNYPSMMKAFALKNAVYTGGIVGTMIFMATAIRMLL